MPLSLNNNSFVIVPRKIETLKGIASPFRHLCCTLVEAAFTKQLPAKCIRICPRFLCLMSGSKDNLFAATHDDVPVYLPGIAIEMQFELGAMHKCIGKQCEAVAKCLRGMLMFVE